ncbi:MAG: glycosyltransferase [Saprospiraceae bacterium]|nr:glycosyltransferase [Saprospiraceae bacterium]
MEEIIKWTGYLFFSVYLISLTYVTFFCLMQLHLLYHYLKKSKAVIPASDNITNSFPFVTIQLPLFNEKYVAGRLIDNIMKMNYPKEKFEVHILDDSTDETVEISKQKAKEYASLGFNIQCITRKNREGYKAGALRDGMQFAKGELIAIFDADFLPEPDFLINTIPYFGDSKTGVVQTRWEHINQNYSLLTRLQAFQLNVHFTVEQKGRFDAGYMLQFNGTAGVWRKSTIEDAGGWEADTLTEDLDLSYRAQMKGWKIIYLEDITAPAELPADINGLKSQQYRWMKGGAETARKMLPKVWKADLHFMKKIHATMHLLSSSIFVFIFLLGVLSVPVIFMLSPTEYQMNAFSFYLLSLLIVIIVYFTANVNKAWPKENKIKMIFKFLFLFPVFLSLSMGLALHNGIAVLQGLAGRQTAFIRTPKFGIIDKKDRFGAASYFIKKLSWISVGEGIMVLYFLMAIIMGVLFDKTSFILLHILLFAGYSILFFYSLRHRFLNN